MKKKILVLITLGWLLILPVTAGVKAVFPYNYPSKNSLKSLVMEDSPKGRAYADYLLYAVNLAFADTSLSINKGNIDILFDNLYSEEFLLEEGEYLNSGYDDVSFKMVPSVGHRWKGFVWTLRIGTYTIRLIKADCANVLIAKVIRIKTVPITVLEKKIEKVQPKEELVERPVRVERSYKSFSLPKQEKVDLPQITPKVRRVNPTFIIAGITFTIAGVGYLVYSLLNKECRREVYTPTNGDNNRWRTPPDHGGGQGQDPPPDKGGEGGGPVDPNPNSGTTNNDINNNSFSNNIIIVENLVVNK